MNNPLDEQNENSLDEVISILCNEGQNTCNHECDECIFHYEDLTANWLESLFKDIDR